MKKIFIFDLDGTITSKETLPLIAKHFNIENEILKLTNETIKGNIPFIESFIRRVGILGKLPIDEINNLIYEVPLYEKVFRFIQDNKELCCIATGNLDCWTNKIIDKIGCKYYTSKGIIEDNKVLKLTNILKKENIVIKYKNENYKVIFIGDGNNDMEAMRLSDISIASGLTHEPARSVLDIADYLIYSEEALCRQLNQLL